MQEAEFSSARLSFRSFREEDAAEIYPEVTERLCRYLSFDPAPDQRAFRQIWGQWSGMMARGEELFLTIRDRRDQAFIGVTGVKDLKGAPELGIWIKEGAQGRGYGRETIERLVAWAADELALSEVDYRVDADNLSSCRIAERLGGVIRDRWRERNKHNTISQMLRYRIRAFSDTLDGHPAD